MPSRLARLVEERGDAIVARFTALIEERRGVVGSSQRSALRDHVPDFLESLAGALVQSEELTPESSEIADQHGEVRWEQGFDVHEVIGDYSILHEAILCEADGAGVAIGADEARRLVRHIAGGSAFAVSNHVKHQLERERTWVEQLEDLGRLRYEFLSNLSHELRTPLHVIQLCSSLLRAGVADPRLQSALDMIERNVARETKLVEDLIDMAALATGRLQLSWAPTDLAAVAGEVVTALEPTAKAKHVRLHEVDADPNAEVNGDRARLYECLWQLVANAVKFTPDGGQVWVTVHVYEAKRARSIVVSVRDTGPGVSPEFLPRILEPFTQQDGGDARKYQGLGLGLGLVRHIIELHGATIDVESDRRGTTFRLRFPAR